MTWLGADGKPAVYGEHGEEVAGLAGRAHVRPGGRRIAVDAEGTFDRPYEPFHRGGLSLMRVRADDGRDRRSTRSPAPATTGSSPTRPSTERCRRERVDADHRGPPEALTASWLTDALGASGVLDGQAVTDVVQTPVGTGQMCDSLRLALTYDRDTDAPATMVAKLPAADLTSRATALSLRSYENEVRFYQQLADGLPMRTPRTPPTSTSPPPGSSLLEDLAPAQQGDQLAGCTPEMAKVAVDELVRLTRPWDDPSLADLEWLHHDRSGNQQFMAMLLPTLWDGFRQRYDADLESEVHEAGDTLFSRLADLLMADSQPWTIVHGDYRLDNLLFDPTPGGDPIAVVDWQTCTHGPALNDVAYFIGAGLKQDDRLAVEDELVRGYHAGLIDAGVGGYDWDTCWHDYRRGTYGGLIMAVAASMLVERTDRGDQMFLTMASRHSRHALDLDAPEVIRLLALVGTTARPEVPTPAPPATDGVGGIQGVATPTGRRAGRRATTPAAGSSHRLTCWSGSSARS